MTVLKGNLIMFYLFKSIRVTDVLKFIFSIGVAQEVIVK